MKKYNKIFFNIFLILSVFVSYNVSAAEKFSKYYNTDTLKCGTVENIPAGLPGFTRGLFLAVKVIIPVILIVMGIVDFLSASTASDEKRMKEAANRFIKRIIAGILVFFVISMVQFLIKLIANSANGTSHAGIVSDASSCITCFLTDGKSCK